MKGKRLLRHPSVSDINQMLTTGHTPDFVSNWLKKKWHQRNYWVSGVTLTEYRTNFLNMSREQAGEKIKQLKAEGKTDDVNAIGAHMAVRDFTEAKNEQTAIIQQVAKEAIDAVANLKDIQDRVRQRLDLIDASTRDEAGNPVFKARNEEIIEKYLGRMESMTNSFIKFSQELKKQEMKSGTTEISISVQEIGKYSEAFKGIIQQILIKLDPSLVNDFIQIYQAEIAKISGVEGTSTVNISINNDNSGQNINISTQQEQVQEAPKQPEDSKNPTDFINIDIIEEPKSGQEE
jgi:hypothetical protein